MTIDLLKSVIAKKGYKWFDECPNIIGIRTTLQVPDVFNDLMCCVWKENGVEQMKVWTVTTDPGVYWLNAPTNPLGTAVLKPNQYINAYSLGLHQNKTYHKALVQVGTVTVYRDNDKDNLAEEQGKENTGLFGINIHRSNVNSVTQKISNWSAGCQVFPNKAHHVELLSICEKFKDKCNNKFTYTLLREIDLT